MGHSKHATYLLVTHSQDEYCAPLVQHHLQKQGKRALVLLTDLYGRQYQFTHGVQTDLATGFFLENEFLAVDNIRAVWNRKYAAPYSFTEALSSADASFLREAHLLLFGFLRAAPVFCLDPLTAALAAENKLQQLLIAQRVGLTVPPTIFSNKAEQIFRFLELHQDQVVVKMQGTLSWSMQGGEHFFYTRRIKAADLKNSTVLNAYPMIYQKMIPKEYELRVIYVDGEVYCGKIPPLPPEIIDWRVPGVRFEWEPATIPAEIVHALKRLMEEMGLKFGAIDIIRSTDGHYYFLEVNPTGEWGMLQKDLGLPIAEEIAETLLRYSK